MTLDVITLVLLASFCLILLVRNFKLSLYILLILSVLLHKELFSIYKWDLMPIRIFMLATLVYGIGLVVNWILSSYKNKSNLFAVPKDFSAFKSFFMDPFNFLLLSMWFVRLLSIYFSRDIVSSISLFGFFTTVVALGLLLHSKLKSSSEEIFKYINFYIYTVFGLCIFGYLQLLIFWKFDLTIGALWSIPGNLPRVGTLFWDVNHFGALLGALLPVLGVQILTSETWKSRIFRLVMFISMSGILLMTNSRTGWIVAAVALAIFTLIWFVRRFGRKGVIAVLLAGVLLTIPVLVEYSNKASPFRQKVRAYFNYRIDSFDSHFLLIQGALEIFQKYPYLGGGYGSFFEQFKKTDISSEYFSRDPAGLTNKVPAHTIWGESLAETGLFGLLTYTLFVFTLLAILVYAALTVADISSSMVSMAMSGSLIGLMIAGIFYSYNSEFFWILLFLFYGFGSALIASNSSLNKVFSYFSRFKLLPLLIVVLIGSYLLLVNLGVNHLIPWDEAIYSKIAKNMFISGNYVVEYWRSGVVWYEKPPLGMWLQAFSMDLLGINSWAARLPSAILGILTIAVTYLIGTKLFNKTVGFLGALALSTTIQFLYYGRSSMLDVTVTFFITAAIYLYILSKDYISETETTWEFWVLSFGIGILCGLGIMTKGVVGFIPLGIIFINELARSVLRIQKWSWHYLLSFVLLTLTSVLVFLPWHYEMYKLFGWNFINQYFIYHVFDRATESIENKGRPFWWYLEVMKVSMRIWFIALIPAVVLSLFSVVIRKSKDYLLLLVWLLFIFFLFSSSVSKLVWYIIPIYPVAAILSARLIERVLTFILQKFPKLDNAVFKTLCVYLILVSSLFYLYLKREMVYMPDLSGAQAYVLSLKNQKFSQDTNVFIDTNIEEPLILFYAGEPYTGIVFKDLEKKIKGSKYDESIVFVTKESRFKQLSETYFNVLLVGQQKEWVLGQAQSVFSLDKSALNNVNNRISTLMGKIQLGVGVTKQDYLDLEAYKQESVRLSLKIEQSLAKETARNELNDTSKAPINE